MFTALLMKYTKGTKVSKSLPYQSVCVCTVKIDNDTATYHTTKFFIIISDFGILPKEDLSTNLN